MYKIRYDNASYIDKRISSFIQLGLAYDSIYMLSSALALNYLLEKLYYTITSYNPWLLLATVFKNSKKKNKYLEILYLRLTQMMASRSINKLDIVIIK